MKTTKKWIRCLILTLLMSVSIATAAGGTAAMAATAKKTATKQTAAKTTKAAAVRVGTTFVSGQFRYKVTYLKGRTGFASLVGVKSKAIAAAVIPNTVRTGSYVLIVNSIGNNAFAGCTKLTAVVTNVQITTIGNNIFYGCSRLAKFTVASRKVKNIGGSAMKGISKKTVITVPRGYTSVYTKLMKSSGLTAAEKASSTKKAATANKSSTASNSSTVSKSSTASNSSTANNSSTASNVSVMANTSAKPVAQVSQTEHKHTFSAWTVSVKATCTQPGQEKRTCSSCGEAETRETAALGHDRIVHAAVAATCTQPGKTTYETCSRCDYKTSPKEIPALGHYMTTQPAVAATCTQTGLGSYELCTRCGYKTTPATIPALGHSYGSWSVTKAATCTAGGTEKRTCTVCGAVETRATAALGHSYSSNYTVDTAATCTAAGSKSKHCTRCSATMDKQTIQKLGHKFGNYTVTKAATCTAAGTEVRTCSVCKATESREVKALGHSYAAIFTVDIAPTCTSGGSQSKHCTRSGCRVTTNQQYLPALGHSYGDWDVTVAATCTTSGTQVRSCKICGAQQSQVIPAKGHSFTEWEAASRHGCKAPGSDKRICQSCGKTEVKQVPAEPHIYERWEEPATCLSRGKRYAKCTVCGDFSYSFIPGTSATGHNFSAEYTIDQQPTCSKAGSQSRHCVNEGCTARTDIQSIQPTGEHTWETVEETAATCTANGVREVRCTVCGNRKYETIFATGHVYPEEYTVKEPATCTANGTEERLCTKCGNADRRVIPCQGHTYGEIQIEKAATCTEDGRGTATCSSCGATNRIFLPKSGEHKWEVISIEESELPQDVKDAIKNYKYSECVGGAPKMLRCVNCGMERQDSWFGQPVPGHQWTTTNHDTAVCTVCGVAAPRWTNEWYNTVYSPILTEVCQKYGVNDWNSLPEDGKNEFSEKLNEKGGNRARVVWAVAYRADPSVCAGFSGDSNYDSVIDANVVFKKMAPEAKPGYHFSGWYNPFGEGTLIQSEQELIVSWKYMGMTLEARYEKDEAETEAAAAISADPGIPPVGHIDGGEILLDGLSDEAVSAGEEAAETPAPAMETAEEDILDGHVETAEGHAESSSDDLPVEEIIAIE